MKIQITMTRQEVVRTAKMIEIIGDIVEKAFGKSFKKVNPSADRLMDPANNNVSYGIGHRAEVVYTADEMAMTIDIKERMYDASCTFCEKVAEKAAPVVNFCMAGVKMLEAFCESFKSDVAHIQSECFEELEKELEESARYAVVGMETPDGDLQAVIFKRYADSKITSIVYEVHTGDAISFEMAQLKSFGKKLDIAKFTFDSLDEAIDELNAMRDRHSGDRRIHVQRVQEEKGE